MFKKFLIFAMMNFAALGFTQAQQATAEMAAGTDARTLLEAKVNSDIDNEDYERLLDNYLKVQFREYAYTNLNLNSQQIEDLDPIFLAYMSDKNDLNDRRMRLMDRYQEEVKEDDRQKDEDEEAAEFIEDYWEVNIAGQELRKDYFDRMEDAIGYEKAFTFFLIEESVENRIFQERTALFIPVMLEFESPTYTYYRELDRYNIWMKNNETVDINGLVKLDHQYTYDGLKQLTSAIRSAVDAVDGDVPNLRSKVNTIMRKADRMQNDAYADNHADLAREAFLALTNVLEEVKALNGIIIEQANIDAMRKVAMNINKDKLYMDQSEHAYMFFTHAQETINSMYTKQPTTFTGEAIEKTENTSSRKK